MTPMLLTLALQAPPSQSWESYLAHVFAAQASLQQDDTALALRWLGKAPKEHRGWEYEYLTSQADSSIRNLSVDHNPARIEFSPDGTLMATSNLDGTVSLFDGGSLAPIGTLVGHENEVWGIAFSPDGETLATTSRDLSVRLWDVSSRRELATLGKHPTTPYACEFSPDGKWLVTPGWQSHPETKRPVGLISVWSIEDRKQFKQWFSTDHPVSCVTFSPEGTRMALGCWEGITMIYDTSDWSLAETLKPEPGDTYNAVDWVEFSPDGKSVLTACKDSSARLYDVASGAMRAKFAGSGNATCARFVAEGTKIVVSWTDQNLRLYTAGGDLIETLRGHTDSVRCFDTRGSRLVSIGEDQTLREWDLSQLTRVRFDAGTECWSAVLSPDDQLIATGGEGAKIRIWRSADGTHVKDIEGFDALVVDVAWSPDGKRILAGSNDDTMRVFDVASGKQLYMHKVGDKGQVRGIGWSPAGEFVAAGQGQTLALWSATTGELARKIALEDGAYSVAFSASGDRIAAGRRGKVAVIDPVSGKVLQHLEEGPNEINEIAWRADGTLLAASGGDGAIHLWNPNTGEKVRTIREMTLSCWALAFSPDGSRLASTGYDFTTRVFDVATGDQTFILRDLVSAGFDVQWSRDGRKLVRADTSGQVTVFDSAPARSR